MAIGPGMAAVCGVAAALAMGDADEAADETTDVVVLGEEDLADRAEILRNRYRRMTPGDAPLVQDVGTWPAAWEEFSPIWNGAAADRDLGTWTVPVAAERDGADTVLRDGAGTELWRGQTVFSKDGTEGVVLTGALVAEEDWPLYRAARGEIARRLATGRQDDGGGLRGTNGPCTNGLHFVSAVGNFAINPPELHVGLAWTNNGMVDVFAYGPLHISETNVVTYTNDENVVVTATNVTWHSVEPTLTGFDNAWEWIGAVAVSNTGTNVFIDNGFPANRGIVRYYAAAEAVDSDGDGLNDGMEQFVWHTDPAIADSDGDGWGDGMEAEIGFDPVDARDVPRVTIEGVKYKLSGNETSNQWVELYSASAREVHLDGFRLEVGRNGVWSNTVVFSSGTVLDSSRYLLIGESNVTNADIQAKMDIPDALAADPTTGVRLRWGGATNGAVVDVVFIGHGPFNTAGLDTTGWVSATSVWNYAGRTLERCFPGLDTDQDTDWRWAHDHDPHNYLTGVVDSDEDGLSDAEEHAGSQNPFGEPTNPWNADSDGDGLSDYDECVTYETNPNTWATDGDIWPWMPSNSPASDWPGSDWWELEHHFAPTNFDENTNGISDIWEWMVGVTNLTTGADSDGDGISDWDEMRQNSNPLDAADSEAKPYVLHYEASRSGWTNGSISNDIGLFGEVHVRFLGAHDGQGVLAKVTEGNVQEEFTFEWKGADEIARFEGETPSVWYTSARLTGNSVLVVKDEGKHPEFINTLGGEYTITNFTATIVPDLDRNRQIDDEDRNRAWRGEPLRFWVNDDDDNGPTADSGNDIPGQGHADADDQTVDGVCDLLDFFPVWVDGAEVLETIPGTTTCRLRQSGALNAVYTDLSKTSAGDFLVNTNPVYGPAFNQCPQSAAVFEVSGDGEVLSPAFAGKIAGGSGVLILEGKSPTSSPLVFEVLREGEPVFSTEMPLDIAGVENMYRWINLRPGGTSSTAEPTNNPDSSSNGKNVFFLHGFNVDAAAARGWNAEIFKRLHQSGSHAKFWGMTWDGDLGFINGLYYHSNVTNAFAVAPGFAAALQCVSGEKIVLAHSLGNMVVAEAMRSCGLQVDKFFMLNAAIAAECFDPAAFNDSPENNNMVDPAWVAYTNVTWASKWHELFPSEDDRSRLTWRGRFAGLSNAIYNYYSSGDEIFETKSGGAGAFSGGPFHLERYAWQKQEMLKGTGSLGGTTWAGWGMRHSQPGSTDPLYTAAQANAIAATNKWHFRETPLFWPSPNFIFSNSISVVRQQQILARGIPALSESIGGDSAGSNGCFLEEVNMDGEILRPNGWGRTDPVYGQQWLHCDIRDMAYLYVFKLFDRVSEKGNLR